MDFRFLSSAQVEHFLAKGYVVLKGCFSREFAQGWTDFAWKRTGYDPRDQKTWKEPRLHLPAQRHAEVKNLAPQAWGAILELVGGEARAVQPYNWADAFIMNLGIGADRPWEGPSAKSPGWHKDGDFFMHFLDSPEQGLLTLVIWSDIQTRGGGTFIAPDSVGVVARYLAQHPEGIHPFKFPMGELIGQCKEFVEMTGEVGDVVLLHPYMLHASSQNVLGIPRFITNPPIHLKEPMNFNRADANEFSLVERGVLRGLGVERYDFKLTGPREKVVPERVKIQQKMLEEEKARLAAASASKA